MRSWLALPTASRLTIAATEPWDATVSLRPRMLERAVAEGLAESVHPCCTSGLVRTTQLLGLQVAPLGPQDLIW